MILIPAPYQVRGKLQPESRVPGENRDPVFKMVPDFRRDDAWTPVPAPDLIRGSPVRRLFTKPSKNKNVRFQNPVTQPFQG
jgi:hypothetical protein